MRNCLSYALMKWLREGGTFMARRSYLAREFGITSKWHPVYWVPHFLHRDKQLNVTQFTVTEEQRMRNKKRGCFLTWITLWHFDGHVIGDDKAEPNGD
jgi:hypothetical protein